MATGISSHRVAVSSSRVPTVALVFLMDSDIHTNRNKTIFGFKNHNVSRVAIERDGELASHSKIIRNRTFQRIFVTSTTRKFHVLCVFPLCHLSQEVEIRITQEN